MKGAQTDNQQVDVEHKMEESKMLRWRRIILPGLLLLVLAQPLTMAAGAGNSPQKSSSQKSWKNSLAVQLWSFRDDFSKDVPGTLRRVRALGFTYVELAGYYGLTAKQFRGHLDKAGLKAVSMHIEYETARDKIDQVIKDAKILGVRHVGVPWIQSPFTRADCLAAIKVFNQAGRRLAANGLQFFYHLHGYEFVADPGGKGTLFDLLMSKTHPRHVYLQLDTFHVAHPGQDPLKLLQKYPGRFLSLHLKDIRKDVVGNDSGEFKEEDARPVGQGKIDWPALLKAARKEGIRWYIIEDETSYVWKGIGESLSYLESLKF
jgi:sugar phosphate isomerase/epimerase